MDAQNEATDGGNRLASPKEHVSGGGCLTHPVNDKSATDQGRANQKCERNAASHRASDLSLSSAAGEGNSDLSG